MEKVRVRELAKELGMKSSKEILLFLERIGQKGKSASSNIDGDVVERVRTHFRKGAPPPPPREKPLEVTRADPPPPPPEVLDHKAETAPPSPDMPQETPAVPEALQAPAVVEEKKAEPEIRVVEAPPPSKAEEERKEKEKKWKKAKPH